MALVLATCGSGGGDDAASPTTTTTSPPAAGDDTGDGQAERGEVDLDLPRSVVYGNLEITVRSVTVSDATPGTFVDDEPEVGDTRYAYVELTIETELSDPGDQVEVSTFALEFADGGAADGEPVDFVSRASIEPGVANEFLVAFPLGGGGDVTSATLVVAEDGRVPARLPLSGAVPDDPYPVEVAVEGSGAVEYEGGCGNATGTFEVTGADVDLDAGADHTDTAIEPNEPKRAREGERWLRVSVRAVAESGTCGGTIANDHAFRLIIDDLPTAPLNRDNELLENGTGTEFVWGWSVPVDAELVLQVGLPDGTTVDVPIELPADLP